MTIANIAAKMGLDMYSRRRMDNRVDFKKAKVSKNQIRYFRKYQQGHVHGTAHRAVADMAGPGRSGDKRMLCQRRPAQYYSSRGLADVTALYDDADNEPAFMSWAKSVSGAR